MSSTKGGNKDTGTKKPKKTPQGPASEEEQARVLQESKNKIDVEAFLMKRSLDTGKLMDALRHASNMIGELRTGVLTPQNYYSLYMQAFNHLSTLQQRLLDELEKGEKMSRLYELVQYAGNILPRLYLLVTVGGIYIKSKEAPAKDVLRDLSEMCKGVQHPIRGLFLRFYLSEMVRDKLPDVGTEYYGEGGDVKDCIEFVLQNFIEMNKLWVRMQYQVGTQDKGARLKEREALRLLVGKNLSRLSALEGVDVNLYISEVLPQILEQIVSCNDQVAQQYLMECIIQVFPDEYHLKTLDKILSTCSQLVKGVNIKTILVSLIDRLASFSQRQEVIPTDIDVFGIFYKYLDNIIESRPEMPANEILQLLSSLLNLSLTCYPGNLEYVDQLLQFCADTLGKLKAKDVDITTVATTKEIVKLLNTPLERFKNILTVLQLEHYPQVMDYLNYKTRKRVSMDIVKNACENNTKISTVDQVSQLFGIISSLIKDEESNPDDIDLEDFEEEQQHIGSLVHLFESDDLRELSGMYVMARKHFGQPQAKGMPLRTRYTLPPLIFAALALATRLKSLDEAISKKVFKFIHETITVLSQQTLSEVALRLFLQAALCANKCGFEEIAYEFVCQAYTVYEEQITDSKDQFKAVCLMISSLQTMTVFDAENYETLVMKTALHSHRLLLKPDQCRAVYLCAHLFWNREGYADGKRVLECLQKALKIADGCMETEITLFVEILNQYLYFYINNNEAILVKFLNGLIALINTNIANKEIAEQSEVMTHYQSTLRYINYLKESGKNPRFAEVEV